MNEQSPFPGASLGGAAQAEADASQADRLSAALRRARDSIARIVIGQDRVIDLVLVTILSGGHALLIGAPGLGKTLLVNTAARVLGLSATRIQFTPDLMPSDITGAEILDQDADGHRAFRFLPGPIFGQLVLADEINRASPRTQSALLQAMAEHRVTQGGKDYPLPRPFHVLATQNPIEQEGTYPLPEAQLDRFALAITLDFPDREAERRMLLQTTGAGSIEAETVLDAQTLLDAQALVRRLPIGEKTVDAILALTRSLRPADPSAPPQVRDAVAYGPGPRAAQTLMVATRARALLDGRLAPSLEDVSALAEPVLSHRIGLSYGAEASGLSAAALIHARAEALL